MSNKDHQAELTVLAGELTQTIYEGNALAVGVAIVHRDGSVRTMLRCADGSRIAVVGATALLHHDSICLPQRLAPDEN